ncbi:MAG: hybrid sensor histidine kinase/response regulator [Bdellovibrionota bacterium]
MGKEGKIWIRTEENKGWATVSIRNSGTVVPPESLPHLFDPFFTKNKSRGTGLGLAIARTFVEKHGGKIWCESSEAEGTCFSFMLPIMEEHPDHLKHLELPAQSSWFNSEAPSTAPSIQEDHVLERKLLKILEHNRSRLKILLLDDEYTYLRLLEHQLAVSDSLGTFLDIHSVRDPETAIRYAIQNEIDLVVCDIHLGNDEMDGFAVTRQLRDLGSQAHICIHSNRVTSENMRTAIEMGADHCFPKPMSRQHLLKFILDYCSKSNCEVHQHPQTNDDRLST